MQCPVWIALPKLLWVQLEKTLFGSQGYCLGCQLQISKFLGIWQWCPRKTGYNAIQFTLQKLPFLSSFSLNAGGNNHDCREEINMQINLIFNTAQSYELKGYKKVGKSSISKAQLKMSV